MQPTYYLNKVLSSQVLKDLEAGKYIHGVAVHWYFDSFVPADLTLGATHHIFPEYYLFGTEACAGWNPLDRGVKLGSWQRAEQYAHDIMEVRASVLLQNCCVVSFQSSGTYLWFQGGVSLHSTPKPPCSASLWAAASCEHSSCVTCLTAQANKLQLVFPSLFSLRSAFQCRRGSVTSGCSGWICLCGFAAFRIPTWAVHSHRMKSTRKHWHRPFVLLVFSTRCNHFVGLEQLCSGLDRLELGVGPNRRAELG